MQLKVVAVQEKWIEKEGKVEKRKWTCIGLLFCDRFVIRKQRQGQVFVDITLRCVKLEPDERPTMGEVEVELEFALSLQKQADRAKYSLFSTTITPTFHLIPASWDLRTLHGTNFPMVQIFQWYKYSSRS